MLNLGFVSAILPNKSLFQVLDYANQQNFDCVEVMCWPATSKDARRYAGVSHIAVDQMTREDLLDLKAKLAKHPVKISALGYYPNPLDPDETQASFYREHIKKVIQAAFILGIERVNTFVGRDYTKNVAYNISR
jgi:sugar phosphate isomerase/epimerase